MPDIGMILIKTVVIGDPSVGKTALIRRFVDQEFHAASQPTNGQDFASTTFRLDAATNIKVQLIDNSGDEKYKAVLPTYRNIANAVLAVYDVTNRQSFDNVVSWIDSFLAGSNSHAIPTIIIVGNKVDKDRRQVSRQEGQQFAAMHSYLFMETSALRSDSVDEAFQILLTDAFHAMNERMNLQSAGSCKAEVNEGQPEHYKDIVDHAVDAWDWIFRS